MESMADPSGKYQRVSSGEMQLPACCAGCGKTEQYEGFVDTKIDVSFHGVIYFCCDCAFEMTTVFPEAPYHTMRNRILMLEADVVAKDAEIASLGRALDGVTAARLSDRGVTVIGDTVIGADVPAESEPQLALSLDANETGADVAEPTESVTDAGPVHVTKSAKRDDPIISL
jgi:hypothetical protein